MAWGQMIGVTMLRAGGLLCAVAGAASAQMACTFETECYEAEGCAEAGFALIMEDGEDGTILVTDFGDLAVEELDPGVWLARSDGLAALLSVGEEGTARASFHLPGPQAVTYLGTCEGQ
ncbi:MAG: hypothetical protein AAF390_04950 [Pseudomonadota bacterium]